MVIVLTIKAAHHDGAAPTRATERALGVERVKGGPGVVDKAATETQVLAVRLPDYTSAWVKRGTTRNISDGFLL